MLLLDWPRRVLAVLAEIGSGQPAAGSGRALGLPGDLSEEARGAGGGQGLGGEMAHDLHVVVDVIAPVEVEGAGELLDVHHVRQVAFGEAQDAE